MSAPIRVDLPAELKARYRLERALGVGGMGFVLAAFDRELDREVAIKILRAPKDPGLRRRFRREAATLARVAHPGVPRVHAFGEAAGELYLVMDLLEGRSLDAVEDLDAALGALEDVASALAEVHREGVFHRDLKPANVFLTADGRGVLLDFGLARAGDQTRMTATGMVVGTPRYLAPELLMGKPHDAATDWYGFGATLFAVLEDHPPYDTETLAGYAFSRVPLEPPRFESLPPGNPLRAWVTRLLLPEPDARPGGAEVAGLPLRELRRGESPRAAARSPRPRAPPDGPAPGEPAPPLRPAPPAPAGFDRRGLAAVAVAVALGLGLAARDGPAPAPPAGPPSTGVAPGGAPTSSAFDRAYARLVEGHTRPCDSGRCPFERSHIEHAAAVRGALTDTRFPLRVSAALAAAREAYEARTPGWEEDARALFSRAFPHIAEDYEELLGTSAAVTEALRWGTLDALSEGQGAREELEELLKAFATEVLLGEGPLDPILVGLVAAAHSSLEPADRRDLLARVRALLAVPRDPVTHASLVKASLFLSDRTFDAGLGCEAPPGALETLLAEVVPPPHDAVDFLESLTFHLSALEGECPAEAYARALAVLPGLLGRLPRTPPVRAKVASSLHAVVNSFVERSAGETRARLRRQLAELGAFAEENPGR